MRELVEMLERGHPISFHQLPPFPPITTISTDYHHFHRLPPFPPITTVSTDYHRFHRLPPFPPITTVSTDYHTFPVSTILQRVTNCQTLPHGAVRCHGFDGLISHVQYRLDLRN